MARSYRILGQSNPTANTLTNLYRVPVGNSAIISSITIANLNESDGVGNSFSIAVNVSGVAVSNTNYIAYRVNCPARDSITLTLGITMNAGSNISVNANSSRKSFVVYSSNGLSSSKGIRVPSSIIFTANSARQKKFTLSIVNVSQSICNLMMSCVTSST